MARPEDIQKKLQKKRNKELFSYFRSIVQQEGLLAALKRTVRFLNRRYGGRRGRFLPKSGTLQRQRQADTTGWPKISVLVPVYNPDRSFFTEMVQSVLGQSYPNWELCIANASDEKAWVQEVVASFADERIHLEDTENGGIAANTNRAARMARGHYIAFLDHDDILSPNALYEVAHTAVRTKARFLYSDEALFTNDYKRPTTGHFKPDYSPQYLLNVNYIGHFVAVRRDVFDKVGGLRSQYDGAQDHDFNLRALEETSAAVHITKVLYYWRQHAESTSTGVEAKPYVAKAAKAAIEDHLRRIGARGRVVDGRFPSTYKVDYAILGRPLVSIIIPNSEHILDLDRCIRSIYEKTHYKQFEVIVVENNSHTVEIFNYYQELTETYPSCKVAVYDEEEGFNFSKICNFGRRAARGEYLLFLNNDTEVLNDDWLDEMLQLCQLPEVGAVGAMLYYPDNTIQHAGVIVGLGGYAGHSHKYALRGRSGYMFRLACVQELSAVTAACMMVDAKVFDQTGGFDPAFSVAFNDVDFCLRVRRHKKSILFTPYAELLHHESKSRGSDEDGEAAQRFAREQERLMDLHEDELARDPFYNPNLTYDREDFSENDVLPEI